MASTVAFFLFCLLSLHESTVYSILTQRSRIALERYRTYTAELSYSNDWAVQIDGGLETANLIASQSGFINMGQVCFALASLNAFIGDSKYNITKIPIDWQS